MQVPFPELTVLQLFSEPEAEAETPVIPDSFLGGSAPRLQVFNLTCTPYPGLPKLLLSATHLVNLSLYGIPHSGYISPEAMVALLPVLSSLETLSLGFLFPHPALTLNAQVCLSDMWSMYAAHRLQPTLSCFYISLLLLNSPCFLLTSLFLLDVSISLPFSPPSIVHCAIDVLKLLKNSGPVTHRSR